MTAVVLRGPHLVLPHPGGDDGIVLLGHLVDLLDGVLRLDGPVGGLVVPQRMGSLPLGDLAVPLFQILPPVALDLPELGVQLGQDPLHVADDRHVHVHVLPNGGGVDVHVDDLAVLRELRQLARDAVVEAWADGDHEIRVDHAHVRRVGPVHPQHPQPQRVGGVQGSQPHEGQRGRDLGQVHQLGQFGRGIRVDDPAAAVDHRAPGRGDEFGRLPDLARVPVHRRVVAPDRDLPGIVLELRPAHDDVLGQVHQDRSGPAAPRDVVGLLDDAGKLFRLEGQEVVLGAGPGGPDHVGFLEGITAHHGRGDLPREDHDGHGIHEGVGQAGHRVGRARARGHDGRPGLPTGLVIALHGVNGHLLVPAQDVPERIVQHDVVAVQDGPARMAEGGMHPLGLEAFHEDLGTCQSHGITPPAGSEDRSCRPSKKLPARPSIPVGPRGGFVKPA